MRITVKKCCCMELPTAGVFIGWIGLTFSVLACIGIIFVLCIFDSMKESVLRQDESEDIEGFPNYRGLKSGIFIYALIVYLLSIIPSALLIVGTKKRSHGMLVPWLIWSALFLVCSAPHLVSDCLQEPIAERIGDVVGFAFVTYLWIVVYSLWSSIRNEEKNNNFQSI